MVTSITVAAHFHVLMTTSHYELNNVCVCLDRNRFQSQGCVDEMIAIEPLKKWEAFGWEVFTVDRHNIKDICTALDNVDGANERPIVIIADTVKEKGISFIENTFKYHNCKLTKDEYESAEKELAERYANLK